MENKILIKILDNSSCLEQKVKIIQTIASETNFDNSEDFVNLLKLLQYI